MDIVKALQVDIAALREGMTRTLVDAAVAAVAAEAQSAVPLAADRASIRPLALPDALQILIAEVRASLSAALDQTDAMVQSAPQAASKLVDLYVRAMPEDAGPPAKWLEALKGVQAAFDGGIDRGLDVVAQWREVPREVLDAVREAHTLALVALGDEPPADLWVRPEWLGLAPQLARLRRLRRRARRRLTDPDYWGPDEGDEERSKP